MAHNLSELRGMNIDDLIKLHDFEAKQTGTDVKYYLAEIARRDQDRQTEVMLSYTKTMLTYTRRALWLTVVVTIATIVNVVVAALQVNG